MEIEEEAGLLLKELQIIKGNIVKRENKIASLKNDEKSKKEYLMSLLSDLPGQSLSVNGKVLKVKPAWDVKIIDEEELSAWLRNQSMHTYFKESIQRGKVFDLVREECSFGSLDNIPPGVEATKVNKLSITKDKDAEKGEEE